MINQFIALLTSEDRTRVLIVDDSYYYDRSCSRKVELFIKVYDHVTDKYVKGFRMLTLGWSDGVTFVPASFSLLSSTAKENRIQERLGYLSPAAFEQKYHEGQRLEISV